MDVILLLFAYTLLMRTGGYKREINLERLDPSLLIAASLVLPVRTAKRPAPDAQCSSADWDSSVRIAHMVLTQAIQKYPGLFQHKNVPWYVPTDEDVPE